MNFDSNGVNIDSNVVKFNSDGVTLFDLYFGVKIDFIGLKFDSKEFRVYVYRRVWNKLTVRKCKN